jgi:hypothetical protein
MKILNSQIFTILLASIASLAPILITPATYAQVVDPGIAPLPSPLQAPTKFSLLPHHPLTNKPESSKTTDWEAMAV